LDAILFDAFAPLREAREAEDRRIVAYVETLDENTLAGQIKYRRVSAPDEVIHPLWPALARWFNHQTHHRGQAHTILASFLGRAPELDLLYFQRLTTVSS
jgi:uncharacterized damage-inducible protein DinB